MNAIGTRTATIRLNPDCTPLDAEGRQIENGSNAALYCPIISTQVLGKLLLLIVVTSSFLFRLIDTMRFECSSLPSFNRNCISN